MPQLFDVDQDQLYDDIEEAYDTETAEAAERYFHQEVRSFLWGDDGANRHEEGRDIETVAMEYFGHEPHQVANEEKAIEERMELYVDAVEAWTTGQDPREVNSSLHDPETYMRSVERHVQSFLGQEFDPQDRGQVMDFRDRARAAYTADQEPEELREGIEQKLRHGAAGKADARQALYDVVTTGNATVEDARDTYRELREPVVQDIRAVVEEIQEDHEIGIELLTAEGEEIDPSLVDRLQDRGYNPWEAEAAISTAAATALPE